MAFTTSSMSIYERLAVMSVSASRVTDEHTIPGAVKHALPAKHWAEVDQSDAGYLKTFARPRSRLQGLRRRRYGDNVVVVVTRFIFDHGVDIADLIDHAYIDARALDGWQEQSTQRWPIGVRHSGWAQQTGTYVPDGAKLFVATTYAVHDRGNVGYLIQATATVGDTDLTQDERIALAEAVQTINLVD